MSTLDYINHQHVPSYDAGIISSLEYQAIPISLVVSKQLVLLYPDPRDLDVVAINKLLSLAEPEGNFDQVNLLRMSNRIATETRRGAGNFLIYHPDDEDHVKSKLLLTIFNSYGRSTVSTENLRGKVLLRYKPSTMIGYDGTPIMVIGNKKSKIIGLGPTNIVGWYTQNSSKFVKVFDL